jgi:hypothetical protein
MYTSLLRATLETWLMSRKRANAFVGYNCCQFVSRAYTALNRMEALNDTIRDVSVDHFWAAELFWKACEDQSWTGVSDMALYEIASETERRIFINALLTG